MSPVIKNTKIPVYELCKNGTSIFNEFFQEIQAEGNQLGKLAGAISIVEHSSNLITLNKKKFRQLNTTLDCKLYEAKSGGIRIYLFHEEKTGRVIVTGGKKDNQEEDIKAVENIIKEYNNGK